MNPSKYIIVLTAVPDEETGQAIALDIIGRRLAACVTVLPPGRSFYRWEGKVTEERECVLVIKTRAELFGALEKSLKVLHPYKIPELVTLAIDQGSADYLDWLDKETRDE
jgi:periplasmic divalent cation tolerance protein